MRYRDSGVALAGLDPKNVRWLREAVSGHHNLAVLELARSNLAAARQGFLSERAALEKITMSDPIEAAELESSLANADSFLGTVAERMGDFPEAIARYGMQVERIEAQVKADLRSSRMKQRLATALGLQSEIMAVAGRRPASLEHRRHSIEIFDQLATQDPANREWQVSLLSARLRLAALLHVQGDPAAAQIVRESRDALEKLAKGATASRAFTTALALAWRLEVQAIDARGGPGGSEAAAQALAIAKSVYDVQPADESNQSVYAHAFIAAGLIAQHQNEHSTAQRHFQRALEIVNARLTASAYWRLLDPAARALALLGRKEESRAIQDRLGKMGYQPLEPWP